MLALVIDALFILPTELLQLLVGELGAVDAQEDGEWA
jgi:hypothetical protein